MAKAKRAAALFEVIHTGRDKPAPLFNSARSWFGRRSRKDDPTIAPIEPLPMVPAAAAVISDPIVAPTYTPAVQLKAW